MLKKLVSTLTILISATAVGAAHAACTTSTKTCTEKVDSILVNEGGKLFIRLANTNFSTDLTCSGGPFAEVEADNAQFKNYYAMALTAQAADMDLLVRLKADGSCAVRYLTLGG